MVVGFPNAKCQLKGYRYFSVLQTSDQDLHP